MYACAFIPLNAIQSIRHAAREIRIAIYRRLFSALSVAQNRPTPTALFAPHRYLYAEPREC